MRGFLRVRIMVPESNKYVAVLQKVTIQNICRTAKAKDNILLAFQQEWVEMLDRRPHVTASFDCLASSARRGSSKVSAVATLPTKILTEISPELYLNTIAGSSMKDLFLILAL